MGGKYIILPLQKLHRNMVHTLNGVLVAVKIIPIMIMMGLNILEIILHRELNFISLLRTTTINMQLPIKKVYVKFGI